jgi:hypothetical protein
MQELSGSRGLLLSIAKPENLPESIEWKQIGFLDYMMYSTFVMHSLYAFIETDYCLMVQDDGWVLNGANFHPEYYEYDYIGGCLPRCYGRQRTALVGDLARQAPSHHCPKRWL